MKQVSKIMWGIVLVALGVVFALNALEITDIDVFFRGWWTLFIIVPSFISVFTDRDKTGGLIGLLVGLMLLLGARGYVDFRMMCKLAIPAVIIVIGLDLIFKDAFSKKAKEGVKKLKDGGPLRAASAVFSTHDDNCSGQTFNGADYTAIFGTVNCNLQDAYLERDVLIKVKNLLGTVNITVPDGVNVEVRSQSIFGGVTNRIPNNEANTLTLYVEAYCLLGNVEIQ